MTEYVKFICVDCTGCPECSWDKAMERGAEIRRLIESGSGDYEALFAEYCRIFPAGKLDASDIAWAKGLHND